MEEPGSPWGCKESGHNWTTSLSFCEVCLSLSHVCLFATPWAESLPGSSVHGILQVRILEWVAIPFSRGSSQPRGQTRVSCIAGRLFTNWATREALTMTIIMTKLIDQMMSSEFYFSPSFNPTFFCARFILGIWASSSFSYCTYIWVKGRSILKSYDAYWLPWRT